MTPPFVGSSSVSRGLSWDRSERDLLEPRESRCYGDGRVKPGAQRVSGGSSRGRDNGEGFSQLLRSAGTSLYLPAPGPQAAAGALNRASKRRPGRGSGGRRLGSGGWVSIGRCCSAPGCSGATAETPVPSARGSFAQLQPWFVVCF